MSTTNRREDKLCFYLQDYLPSKDSNQIFSIGKMRRPTQNPKSLKRTCYLKMMKLGEVLKCPRPKEESIRKNNIIFGRMISFGEVCRTENFSSPPSLLLLRVFCFAPRNFSGRRMFEKEKLICPDISGLRGSFTQPIRLVCKSNLFT